MEPSGNFHSVVRDVTDEVNMDDIDFAILIGRAKDGTAINEPIGNVDEFAIAACAKIMDTLAHKVIDSLIVLPEDGEA